MTAPRRFGNEAEPACVTSGSRTDRPSTPPDPAARQLRRELMQRQDSTIRTLLKPDQQQAWDRTVEQMRTTMPQRPGG